MGSVQPPSGAPGSGKLGGSDDSSQGPQVPKNFFPSMHFTPKEYEEFMDNEFIFLSQIVKHDMQRMKEQMEKMKREET